MSDLNYIRMMEDSLEKKIDILRQIQLLCEQQREIFENPNATPDELQANVDAKENMIQELEKLDEGFESMYQRVADELVANKEKYKDNISHMQEQIREITDRSSNLQVVEQRNKELAKTKFTAVRSQIKELRQSTKAVSSYYQNMMKGTSYEPQFMDSKK